VSNIGGTATTSSGQITVEDALDENMFTNVSASGTGWSCEVHIATLGSEISVTCTSSSVIPAGGSAFPITLTVLTFVSGTVTNMASVSWSVTGSDLGNQNSASDPTIIVAAVPTLPQWAMMALAVLLGLAGFAALRRRAT
jgi:hypothetical protein